MSRRILSLALLPLAFSLAACAGEEEEPSSPNEAAIAQATELTDPIEQSLDNPTGIISAETAGNIFQAMEDQEAAQMPLGFLPGAGVGATPQQSDPGSQCYEVGAHGGTMDMGCITGGGMTGHLVYAVGTAGDDYYVYFEYDHICMTDGICLDGEGAQKMSNLDPSGESFEAVMAFDLVVSEGTESYEVDYGLEMIVDGDDFTLQYVVIVDGESYVVTWSTDGSGFQYTITGSNGTYSCTAQHDEATGQISGSCTGASDFSF